MAHLQVSVGEAFEVVVLVDRREQEPGFEHRESVSDTPTQMSSRIGGAMMLLVGQTAVSLWGAFLI